MNIKIVITIVKQYIPIYLIGFCMGGVDMVPGISGSTVALLCGIYDRLIQALASIPQAIRLVLQFKFYDAWQKADANFLCVLLLGILTGVFSLVGILSYLLEQHPLFIWSCFFGFSGASILLINKQIKALNNNINTYHIKHITILVLGMLIAYSTTKVIPIMLQATSVNYFIGGMFAICAMLLPGISGSFVLVLLGLYTHILESLKSLDIVMILYFVLGCVAGLLAFSKVLSWLISHYKQTTLIFMLGIIIGSLHKIWPWKIVTIKQIVESGKIIPIAQENVFPSSYAIITGENSYTFTSITIAVISFVIVIIIDFLISKRSSSA